MVERDAQGRSRSGDEARRDGFFEAHGDRRPDAEELLEGLLRYAAETYEERKLPYMAHLYDAVVHDASISPSMAIYLLKLAHDLTYRQLIALAAYADRDREDALYVGLLAGGALELPREPDPSVTGEMTLLQGRGLIADRRDEAEIEARMSGREDSRRYHATEIGTRLAGALRLSLIADDDIRSWLLATMGRRPSG